MKFRYDFGEKLDLSLFTKQATHYIGSMRELTYELFLPDYKMEVQIVTPDNCTGHTVSLSIYDIERDSDGDLTEEQVIIPLIDTRFKENKDIKEVFVIDHYKANFDSNNAADTTGKICKLLKLIHKINHLKAFL